MIQSDKRPQQDNFSKTRSAALSQVLLKFADCGEYLAGINLYERD